MSGLEGYPVDRIGRDYAGLGNPLSYLSKLALNGALEIDRHIRVKNHGFNHVRELAGILERYQLKDTDTALSAPPQFPYIPLWRVVSQKSDKDIRQHSELALEMRLLISELRTVPDNPNRLDELRSLLVGLSREFSNEHQRKYSYPHRLVA